MFHAYAIWAAVIAGFALGLWLRPFLSKNPLTKTVEKQQLSAIMDRIVNTDEVESRGRMKRVELQRAGRRTQRFDGGSPARVHKMRRRKRINIHPD